MFRTIWPLPFVFMILQLESFAAEKSYLSPTKHLKRAAETCARILLSFDNYIKIADRLNHRKIAQTRPMSRADVATITGLDKSSFLFRNGRGVFLFGKTFPTYEQVIEDAERFLKTFPNANAQTLNGAILFHGSRSASLLAFSDYAAENRGYLLSPLRIWRGGRTIYSGELIFTDINSIDYFATVDFRNIEIALSNYAKFQFRKKETAQVDQPETFNPLQVYSVPKGAHPDWQKMFTELLERRREHWETRLNAAERALVSENFPVVYGIRPTEKTQFVGAGFPQVTILQGIRHPELRTIYVPESKVSQVQSMIEKISELSHVKVFAIERIFALGEFNFLGTNVNRSSSGEPIGRYSSFENENQK